MDEELWREYVLDRLDSQLAGQATLQSTVESLQGEWQPYLAGLQYLASCGVVVLCFIWAAITWRLLILAKNQSRLWGLVAFFWFCGLAWADPPAEFGMCLDGGTRTWVYDSEDNFFETSGTGYGASIVYTAGHWQASGSLFVYPYDFEGDPWDEETAWPVGWSFGACPSGEHVNETITLVGHGRIINMHWDAEDEVYTGHLGNAVLVWSEFENAWVGSLFDDEVTISIDPSTCDAETEWQSEGYHLYGCGEDPEGDPLPGGNEHKPAGWPDRFFISFPRGFGKVNFLWDESRRGFVDEGAVEPETGEDLVRTFILYNTGAWGAGDAWVLMSGANFGIGTSSPRGWAVRLGPGEEPLDLPWTQFGLLFNAVHSLPPAGMPASKLFFHQSANVSIRFELETGTDGRWWYQSSTPSGWLLHWQHPLTDRAGWYLLQGVRSE